MNQLPIIGFRNKEFFWDSRFKEFRKTDDVQIVLKVDNTLAECTDYAIKENNNRLKKLCILEALEQNDIEV